MAKYLRTRIELGKLEYDAVIKKFPSYKNEIDELLIKDGYEYLITKPTANK